MLATTTVSLLFFVSRVLCEDVSITIESPANGGVYSSPIKTKIHVDVTGSGILAKRIRMSIPKLCVRAEESTLCYELSDGLLPDVPTNSLGSHLFEAWIGNETEKLVANESRFQVSCGLGDLFARHGTDKKSHNYANAYCPVLWDRRLSVERVLELGVGDLLRIPSLRAWADFFPNANIYGVDRGTTYQSHPRISVISSEIDTDDLLSKLPESFDLVIDDASHLWTQQVKSFYRWWPRLKEGGLYVIEDMLMWQQEHVAMFGGSRRDVIPNENKNCDAPTQEHPAGECFFPQRPADHPLLDPKKMPSEFRDLIESKSWYWTITGVRQGGGLDCAMFIFK